MSTQLGRISGALLKDNLLREGVDLAFETDLLYFDVNTAKIGIKSSSPTRDLYSPNEIQTTDLIIDTLVTVDDNITINNTSQIATYFNDLEFQPHVVATHLVVGDFDIDGVSITQTASNADFDFRPDGTGIFKVVNDLNVFGNLHATGDITLEGNVIFGSDINDNVSFSADVDSNLIPTPTEQQDLGTSGKAWQALYAELLNGEVLTLESLLIGGIDNNLRQGNIWYVAAAGSSGHVGNHQNSPFESLERALANAVSGDIIFVYPGTYYELLPLTVPAGVSIKGVNIRTVIIEPDTASGGQDVFLLNDACTISDLTVKNHTYDSLNDTGYAFRFANNFNLQTRSPYVQNITVITSGVNAGKGALVDGAVANTTTLEASMLFHSATFITPGVDCITMTNGVRVEWLNSFTYYANRGLYALQGIGRTTNDGSSIRYGAEVRSIGSANVYGTYGAVADGADTLMYLINHNFAYIGTGTDSSNDPTLVIQANETVELNSGQIHYTTFDHAGTFRVGDTFWIDLKNGTTSFDLSSVSVGDLAGIEFRNGDDVTFVDFSRIETGNIQIAGNIIRSNLGDVNITSASNEINLDQDVFITKNLDISNNLTIAGQLNLGNQITDTVSFEAEIDDNLDPKADNTYSIGSPTRNWNNIWSRTAEISDIEINTNYIRTQISNADLELRTSGTGTVLVENIRVQQRTISTDSTNIQIQPATTLDITTSTTTVNGDVYVSQNLINDADTTFGNTSNDKIRFEASINSNIEPQLNSVYELGNSNRSWNLYTGKILLDEIEINDNYIETTVSNLNLEFRANGTGNVLVEQTYFNENLIYTVGTNLKIEPATTLDIIANTLFDSELTVTNNISFDTDINLGNDPTDKVTFISSINSSIIPQLPSVYDLGGSYLTWNLYTGKILLDEIEINDNYIQTTVSNLNLELKANGTGSIIAEQTYFNENLIYTVGTNLKIEPATTLDITGNTTQNGNLYITNNVYLDSNLTIGNTSSDTIFFNSRINSSIVPFINQLHGLGDNLRSWNLYTDLFLLDDIEINDNYIETTASNLNLELKANGSGSIQLEQTYFNENLIYTLGSNLKIEPATTLDITGNTTQNGNVYVTNDVYLDSNLTIGNTSLDTIFFNSRINSSIVPYINEIHGLGDNLRSWNLYTDKILLDDVEINDNYIQTTASNLNLEFRASGSGSVQVEKTYFDANLIYTVGTNLKIDPATTLDITSSTTTLDGNLRVTNNLILDSNLVIGNTTSDLMGFNARVSSDIIPYTNLTHNLGNTTRAWNLYTDKILLDDIEINDNYIQTNVSNLNIEFKANGTGAVRIEQVDFNENIIRTTGSNNLRLQPATTLDIFATTNVNDNLTATGDFNFNGTITIGNQVTDTITFVADIDSDLIPDVDITYNIGSLADRWKDLWVRNTVISDIEINTNYITTTNGNLALDLRGNSSGGVRTEDLIFRNNTLLSGVTNQNIQVSLTGTSVLDINTNTALRIPRGTLTDRPISNMLQGEIRFNTAESLFAGLATTRVTFGGVYSQNRLTYARAEPTSNIINFIVNSTNNPAYIDSSKVWLTGLQVDNITLQNNIISTNNINLVFDPDLSNTVDVDDFSFDDNQIVNLSNNSLTFSTTGTGYLKFDGSYGIVIPSGTDSERELTPEDGTTRWNTDDGWLEVYFAGTWQLATATSGSAFASEAEVEEIGYLWSLLLG